MGDDFLKVLRCTYCKQSFRICKKNNYSLIIQCKCQKYPLVKGILYLKKDKRKKRALTYLESGNERLAIKSLIDFKRRLLSPASLLLLPSIFNSVCETLFHKELHKILGFKIVIRLLTLFSYPKLWTRYLIHRDHMPTFYMALLFEHVIKKGDYVLDFGCGVGQLLPKLAEKSSPSRIIGIDKDFFNLILAREYFANADTLLICCEAEQGLPIQDNTMDTIIAVDSYHNLTGKKNFLKETHRLLKNSGILTVIHCANFEKKIYENIFGMEFDTTTSALKEAGFNIFKR